MLPGEMDPDAMARARMAESAYSGKGRKPPSAGYRDGPQESFSNNPYASGNGNNPYASGGNFGAGGGYAGGYGGGGGGYGGYPDIDSERGKCESTSL